MELDLHQLIRIARRRWWIVVLLTVVAGGSAYWNVSREIPLYQATASIVVNPGAITGSSGSYTSLYDSERIAATYVQLINTQPVRDRVEASFGDERVPGGVSASVIDGTLLIQVSSVSEDPELAADTANAYVVAFQDFIDDQNQARVDQSRAGVDAQIDFLRKEIDAIDASLATATGDARTDLQLQRQTYNDMISQLETDAAKAQMQAISASTFIEGVDPATDGFQISPNVSRTTMLGAIVGMMLAVGLIALLEYLDNTVKGHTNIQHLTHAPLLASIPIAQNVDKGSRQIYTLIQPNSGASEAIRLLRANLSFAGVDHDIRSITITSSVEGEGKSTTAANLAVALATSGKAVALVDADLRKPTLHRIFGIQNGRGVSTFIANHSETIESVAERVALPGLTFISCGPIPPNPSEMLASPRFQQLIELLSSEYDMVIVDSPPVLKASDALMVGSVTDGVLLITQHGRTRIDSVTNSTAQIHHSGTRLIGVVVNRVDKTSSNYYGGGYYGTYQDPEETVVAQPMSSP